MPFIDVTYEAGVLEGKAAGFRVERGDIGKRALVGLSKTAMETRITKMITGIYAGMREFAAQQFETSGHGLEAVSAKFGLEIPGGSAEPWEPLAERTITARLKGQGYYMSKGGGVKPLLWTKVSKAIAVSSITKTTTSVTARVTHYTLRFNEGLRPVFPLQDVQRLSVAIAKKAFARLRMDVDKEGELIGRSAAVDEARPFGFSVGEARPFSFPKAGRARTGGGKAGTLLNRLKGAGGKKRKTGSGVSKRDLARHQRLYQRMFGGDPEDGDD